MQVLFHADRHVGEHLEKATCKQYRQQNEKDKLFVFVSRSCDRLQFLRRMYFFFGFRFGFEEKIKHECRGNIRKTIYPE